jgi:hypothetical protein
VLLSILLSSLVVAHVPSDGFGRSLAAVRFAEAGRAPLVVVGAPGAQMVCAFEGVKGEVRWCVRGKSWIGFEMAEIADLDGDGASDLAVEDGDELVLLSGASGVRMDSIRLHGGASSLAALQREGEACLVAGGLAKVTCLSIASKQVVWEYEDVWLPELRVSCVCSVPDVDGDGVQDVVAGFEWRWDGTSWALDTLREVLVCLSGATGKRLFGVNAKLGDRLGHSITACGDWNGDGIEDFVAGAPRIEVRNNSIEPGEGHAFVISGRDGEILSWLFSRSPTEGFGWSCATLPGVSQRILISAYEDLGEEALYGCSAIERKPRRLHAPGPFSDFGYLVHPVGDQDGDGVEDYAVSSVYQDLDCDWNGMVTIFSGASDCQLCVLRRSD